MLEAHFALPDATATGFNFWAAIADFTRVATAHAFFAFFWRDGRSPTTGNQKFTQIVVKPIFAQNAFNCPPRRTIVASE
jgi:hypothetical protein